MRRRPTRLMGGTQRIWRADQAAAGHTRLQAAHGYGRPGVGQAAAIIGAGVNAVATFGTMWMQYDAMRRGKKQAEHEAEREAARQAAREEAARQAYLAEQAAAQQAAAEGVTIGSGGAGAGGAEPSLVEKPAFQIALVAVPVILGALMSR